MPKKNEILLPEQTKVRLNSDDEKIKYFATVFRKVKKKYGKVSYRLAAEGWNHDWQVLIATIMSAQTRDETTIPIAENLFKTYKTLPDLANASYEGVFAVLRSINYNRTKSKNVIACAQFILTQWDGKIPDDIDEMIRAPGVGRKTANLVMTEVFKKPAICVDTHVHRISNLFGFVQTKSPDETEKELKRYLPKRYWADINRLFVLWGKEVPGNDKNDFLLALESKDTSHYIYK